MADLHNRPLKTIVVAGLIAGVLDLAYVIGLIAVKAPPIDFPRVGQLLQGIAAGAIGRVAANQGGSAAVALGLAVHFAISLAAAAIFYAASRRLRYLTEYWWSTGPIYGAWVWVVMNVVVLPLSANPPNRFPPRSWEWVLLAHVLCVGLPIAWVVRRSAVCRAKR